MKCLEGCQCAECLGLTWSAQRQQFERQGQANGKGAALTREAIDLSPGRIVELSWAQLANSQALGMLPAEYYEAMHNSNAPIYPKLTCDRCGAVAYVGDFQEPEYREIDHFLETGCKGGMY